MEKLFDLINKKNPNLGNGKKVKMSDKKIKEILQYDGNVSEFCRAKKITRQMYYRFKNWDKNIKNERDRKRFRRIEKEIEDEQNINI